MLLNSIPSRPAHIIFGTGIVRTSKWFELLLEILCLFYNPLSLGCKTEAVNLVDSIFLGILLLLSVPVNCEEATVQINREPSALLSALSLVVF